MITMERSRKQAEDNQARMMETQAKMLEQIANKLAEPREIQESRKEIRKPRGDGVGGGASPADALSWRYLASARWVALQLGDNVFHTSINMSRPPLCAMQVLGNELLRRPDLLVVLQRIEELEVVTLPMQVTVVLKLFFQAPHQRLVCSKHV